MKKFVLLSTQRSGSSWVIDMLNSHLNVSAYSELFLRASKEHPTWAGATDVVLWNAYWHRTRGNRKIAFLDRAQACFRYLDTVYSSQDESMQSAGFKLMYSQLRQHPFLLYSYLLVNRVSIIHLVRSNFLNVLLSEKASLLRNTAHARVEVQRVQVLLQADTLLDSLRKKEWKIKLARVLFSHLGLPYLEVTYEELVADSTRFSDILDFLGIEGNTRELQSPLTKLNKGSHRQLIANYDEVRQLLEGTRYADLLGE